MLDVPKMMFKQLENFVRKKNKIGYYYHIGYKLYYCFNDHSLLVEYKGKRYLIKIVNKIGEWYWHLEPYNNSFFETRLDEDKCNLDMVLFAIKEDGELYGKN